MTRAALRRWVLLVGALALPGCGTINSVASGCPGAYSGVHQDLALLAAYGSVEPSDAEVPLGLDGELGDAWDRVFVALDVPLSAVIDTLALPVTHRMTPRAPTPPALGCGWAGAERVASAP